MTAVGSQPKPQPFGFLALYALASSGGAVAYVPFLTLLLPLQIQRLSGTSDIDLLAYITFGGAAAASLSNIAFGWLSDRTQSRRPWILAGLVLSSILLVLLRVASNVWELVALLVAWQIALNMMLAPLAAWAGDCFPDSQKGLLGGMLSFAPAFGALAGVLVTLGPVAPQSRNLLIAGLVILLVLPALAAGRGRIRGELLDEYPTTDRRAHKVEPQIAVLRMWAARLLVQIAEAALFAYAVFWLLSLGAVAADREAARMFGSAMGIAVPLALLAGRWSDRRDRPILPLFIASAIATAGLVAMAFAKDISAGTGGYLVFGVAGAVFLSLHSAQTLRVLPRPRRRGRDLGVFNLTNTVPSLIMPWVAIGIIPTFGFSGLFWLLAALTLVATLMLSTLLHRV